MSLVEQNKVVKGKPLPARTREALMRQMRELYEPMEPDYPAYFLTAEQLLSDQATDPRFPFVVRQLWLEWCGEPPEHWQDSFRATYMRFCQTFDWTMHAAPAWVTPGLVFRTLSLCQRRYPVRLRTSDALSIIHRVGLLQGEMRHP
jgi:hypothetical protein